MTQCDGAEVRENANQQDQNLKVRNDRDINNIVQLSNSIVVLETVEEQNISLVPDTRIMERQAKGV